MLTDNEIRALITGVYDGFLTLLNPPQNLHSSTFNTLMQGVGVGFASANFDNPNPEVVGALANNVNYFSAVKTSKNIWDLQKLMFDAKGFKRSFDDFYKDAQGVYDVYNKNWLKTEYITAINQGYHVARWESYQADKDIFPYLQYKTVGDGRVRDSHMALHNIVRKVNDPFWDKSAPANGFRCRCRLIRLSDDEGVQVTPFEKGQQETLVNNIDPLFQFNPGKSQLVFSEKHAYFNSNELPPRIKTAYSIEKKSNFGLRKPSVHGIQIPLYATFGNYDKAAEEVKDYLIMQPSEEVYDAFKVYSTVGGKDMNSYLRGFRNKIKPEEVEIIENLKRGLAGAPKFAGQVFRGVSFSDKKAFDKYKKGLNGSFYSDKGFMSTSASTYLPDKFANKPFKVFFDIESKTGVALKEVSKMPKEMEVLFRPRTKFLVSEYNQETENVLRIKLTEL